MDRERTGDMTTLTGRVGKEKGMGKPTRRKPANRQWFLCTCIWRTMYEILNRMRIEWRVMMHRGVSMGSKGCESASGGMQNRLMLSHYSLSVLSVLPELSSPRRSTLRR